MDAASASDIEEIVILQSFATHEVEKVLFCYSKPLRVEIATHETTPIAPEFESEFTTIFHCHPQ
jgi:hypothetical protein